MNAIGAPGRAFASGLWYAVGVNLLMTGRIATPRRLNPQLTSHTHS